MDSERVSGPHKWILTKKAKEAVLAQPSKRVQPVAHAEEAVLAQSSKWVQPAAHAACAPSSLTAHTGLVQLY